MATRTSTSRTGIPVDAFTFLAVAMVAATMAMASASSACIPMSKLKDNMPLWVNKVPYSHSVNKTWGYPTDCSGFVSWALQVPKNLKAYEYGSRSYATRISTDDLRHGDIVTHVWDNWRKNRCTHSNDKDVEDDIEDTKGAFYRYHYDHYDRDEDSRDRRLGIFDYCSGHVFFFDKWDDEATKTHFWAYESTETEDQTKECLSHKPSTQFCFNHHVKKARKKIDKWSKDNCTSTQYGYVTGGAHRLSSTLLCPS